ncbi:MAG: NlpC/P60 family protein [Ferruginibacter sp.]
MKHLFFVAVATGIFSGTSISVKAQVNVNIERPGVKTKSARLPKFIEDIELIPQASAASLPVEPVWSGDLTANNSKTTSGGSVKNIEESSTLQFKYAMMMNREVESITNTALYAFIDDWWATRYRYGGTDRSGIDCSAFTGKLLLQVYGISAPRTAKDQFDICEKISDEDLAEGDLVFFNTRGGVSHVGLYLGNKYFAHSSVHGGVTISSLSDDYYSKKYISGGRITIK